MAVPKKEGKLDRGLKATTESIGGNFWTIYWKVMTRPQTVRRLANREKIDKVLRLLIKQ